MSGKELFIRFTVHAFRKLLSKNVFSYFPFGFEGRLCDLIVSVPLLIFLLWPDLGASTCWGHSVLQTLALVFFV